MNDVRRDRESIVEGPELYAPEQYWQLARARRAEICNGCGSAQAKFDFVPDTIYGLNINPACNIHDYMYFMGATVDDKAEADRVFLNNILRLINHRGGWLRYLRRRRALKYYTAVVEMGGPAYWDGKNGPETLKQIKRQQ